MVIYCAIAPHRKPHCVFLQQMDGIESAIGDASNASVIVMAASNCPWDLDEAFRRRLEKRIYVPLPDEKSREQMYEI